MQTKWDVNYQEIIDMSSGEVVSYEALFRIEHEDLAAFIERMEVERRSSEITEFVLRRSFKLLSEIAGVSVSINISAQELEIEDYAKMILEIALGEKFNLKRLVIEITESRELKTSHQVMKNFLELKTLGVRFAVDDFGVKHSNIERILNYDFDIVKLDRMFLKGIESNKMLQPQLEDIIRMIKRQKLKIVMEGIEDTSGYLIAQQVGAQFIQGYFIGRPKTKEMLVDKLSNTYTSLD